MIRIALMSSERSTHSVFWHGAVVERAGAVIATGYNHGEQHAEVVALRKLWPSKRRGTIVWSVRRRVNGLANARPCPACMEYMRSFGVKAVVYTDCNGDLITEKL